MSPRPSSLPTTRESIVGLSPSICASVASRTRSRLTTTASTDAWVGVRSSLAADWFIALASRPMARRSRATASASNPGRACPHRSPQPSAPASRPSNQVEYRRCPAVVRKCCGQFAQAACEDCRIDSVVGRTWLSADPRDSREPARPGRRPRQTLRLRPGPGPRRHRGRPPPLPCRAGHVICSATRAERESGSKGEAHGCGNAGGQGRDHHRRRAGHRRLDRPAVRRPGRAPGTQRPRRRTGRQRRRPRAGAAGRRRRSPPRAGRPSPTAATSPTRPPASAWSDSPSSATASWTCWSTRPASCATG